MYVYLHILSFKFETKVRSMRVLNRKEGAEAGKNGDGIQTFLLILLGIYGLTALPFTNKTKKL